MQKVRAAASKTACQNNLKQVALGLHGYASIHQALPPGHRSLNSKRLRLSGWPLSVLPHIEQEALHAQAERAYQASPLPFFDPPHTGLHTVVKTLACPADPRIAASQRTLVTRNTVAFTSYLGVSGRDCAAADGALYQDSQVRLASVADGTSNTLLLGERPPAADLQYGWWYAGTGQLLTGSGDMILGAREANILPARPGAPCRSGVYAFQPASSFDDPCGMFHY